MAVKSSVFIATSLDGFIARADGDLDWLTENGNNQGNEDYGYQKFIDSVDAVIMGRNTFEKVLTFSLEKWPYSKRVIALTTHSLEIPDHLTDKVTVMSGSPRVIVDQLSREGLNHFYIDGGKTIQSFLNAGLINEMIITRIPVIIGDGIPLFGPVENDIRLKHISTTSFKSGLVQSKYKMAGDI
ncbi:MAG TPA: dihydrofolate reductase family protein [Balneolaceae bacterium]